MERPLMTLQAGGFHPLVKAARADAAGIESIPSVTALDAKPLIIWLRRPIAFRTANSWTARAACGRFL